MISEEIKNKGKLYKGYIVGMNLVDKYKLCVDVYFDGSLHSILDDSFIDYYEIFDSRYSIKGSTVFVKGIPVDIYTYNDDIYLDLNSIEREIL